MISTPAQQRSGTAVGGRDGKSARFPGVMEGFYSVRERPMTSGRGSFNVMQTCRTYLWRTTAPCREVIHVVYLRLYSVREWL